MCSNNNIWSLLLLGFLLFDPSAAEPNDILITGRPATPEFVQKALTSETWARRMKSSLRPGHHLRTSEGNYLINVDWTPPNPAIVALSDHPEKVETRGGLFSGGLTKLRPLIFQYYHLGKLDGDSPNLAFYLYNSGSSDSKVHVMQGIGKPSLDYFSSGHTNNIEWLKAKQSNLGLFISVPAGETLKIFEQDLPKERVVSGTLGLTQVEGSPLQFAFVARENQWEQPALDNLLKEGDVHSRGFYPIALQKIFRVYEAGTKPLNIVVGAVRQQTFSGVKELRGDYGVTYEVELSLKNSTQRPQDVSFIFNPRGGAATGTILLEQKILEIPLTQAFQEFLFHKVTLEPKEKRTIKLTTIPEGASSYPIRIVVKSTDP